jgi:nicotinic acid mononucleotide adenylyltransferase
MNIGREIVQELLEGTEKTVAIYGGGFKPPTKGHFEVAKLALEKHPNIDELIIYVGSGVRDGVTQQQSVTIWNIYKTKLSDKVQIITPDVPPVRAVLRYAKDNPDTKVIWILGAREDREEDFTDIAKRTKSIAQYPNLTVEVI